MPWAWRTHKCNRATMSQRQSLRRDLDRFQQAVLATTSVRRTRAHARNWRAGADQPGGNLPPLAQFDAVSRRMFRGENAGVTPDELRLLREQVGLREAAYDSMRLRNEFGAPGSSLQQAHAREFLLAVERANLAVAQRDLPRAAEMLRFAVESAERIKASLGDQPSDALGIRNAIRQHEPLSFEDDLRGRSELDADRVDECEAYRRANWEQRTIR